MSFSPSAVDTAASSQDVTVLARVTDDLSGISGVSLQFSVLSSTQTTGAYYASCSLQRYASVAARNPDGVPTDAVAELRCTFPQYSRAGTWWLSYVHLTDQTGNYRSLGSEQADALAPSRIVVSSIPPPSSAHPEIQSVTIDPPAVDVSTGAATISARIRVTSGAELSWAYVCAESPSFSIEWRGVAWPTRTSSQQACWYFSPSSRTSGTAFDGTYAASATISQYAKGGPWRVTYASAAHVDGASVTYHTTGGSSVALDVRCQSGGPCVSGGPSVTPTALEVTSQPEDLRPPVLEEFNLSSTSVDVALSAQSLRFNASAIDDLSGFNQGCVTFRSPNGQQHRYGCFSASYPQGEISFPRYSEAGNWNAVSFYVVDRAGRYRYYADGDINDLATLGFPSAIQVSAGMRVLDAVGIVGGSVELEARLTNLGVPVQGKTVQFALSGAAVGSATTDVDGVAILAGVPLGALAIGNYPNVISARFSGDALLAAVSGTANLSVIAKKPQYITFGALQDRLLADSPFTVNASASSGLPVSFVAGGVCTVSGTQVTLTGGGECRITATQAGDGEFAAAANVTRAFTVTARSDQTLTFASLPDRTYGDPAFTVSATASSGLAVSFSAAGSCAVSGASVTLGAVGTCSITASQPGNASYAAAPSVTRSFTIRHAPLTVTAKDASRQYGAANPPLGASYSGFVNGEGTSVLTAPAECTTTASVSSPAGSYPITCSGAAAANYELTYVAGTLSVTKAPLTVTATSAEMVLRGDVPSLGATYSGFVAGEGPSDLGGALTCETTATSASGVGSYPITCGGHTSTSYDLRYVAGTLKVVYAAAGAACSAGAGHAVLEPVNSDGTSVWRGGRVVPVKFRVCDAAGASVGTPGLVVGFYNVQRVAGTVATDVEAAVESSTVYTEFRWDPAAQHWVFNLDTRGLPTNTTYVYEIRLDDGSAIRFQYGLR